MDSRVQPRDRDTTLLRYPHALNSLLSHTDSHTTLLVWTHVMSLASIAAPNVSSLSTLRNTPSKRERLRNRALRRDKAPDSTASGDTSGTVPTPEVLSLRPVGSPSDHVDSQRKHISTPPPQIGSSLIQSTTTNKPTPSSDNILKWTLTEEAIAPCFIKDVMGMREHTTKGAVSYND